MKHCITILLLLALIFTLCACRSAESEIPTEENPSNTNVQIGNPWGEVDGPEVFRDRMLIDLEAPEGAENCQYQILYVGDKIAQIRFSYKETEYTLRASKKEGDISGVYGPFEETEDSILLDHPAGGCEVKLRYTTEGGVVADWVMLGLQYSLSASQIADREVFSNFVTQIISDKLDAHHQQHQQYLQQSFANAACEGHVEIISGGETYEPYVTVAYGAYKDKKGMIAYDCPLVRPEEVKTAGVLPSITYGDNFEVIFSDGGKLDHVILYDGDYIRLEDRWNLDFFADLESGTYFVNIIMHEDRSGGEYTGYQCVFELVVP